MFVSSQRLRYLRQFTIRSFILVVLCAAAFGQSQTGSLSGIVMDPGNAAIPGVSVDATLTSAGVTLHTITSDAGIYVFPSLPVGLWSITAEKSGFKKLIRNDVQIFIAQHQSLDLPLE